MSGGAQNIAQAVMPTVTAPFTLGRSLLSNMKPEKPPTPLPPPAMTPPPSANDQNPTLTAQQRSAKLKQLQMGLATTITQNSAFGNAPTATPGLKAKLGS